MGAERQIGLEKEFWQKPTKRGRKAFCFAKPGYWQEGIKIRQITRNCFCPARELCVAWTTKEEDEEGGENKDERTRCWSRDSYRDRARGSKGRRRRFRDLFLDLKAPTKLSKIARRKCKARRKKSGGPGEEEIGRSRQTQFGRENEARRKRARKVGRWDLDSKFQLRRCEILRATEKIIEIAVRKRPSTTCKFLAISAKVKKVCKERRITFTTTRDGMCFFFSL